MNAYNARVFISSRLPNVTERSQEMIGIYDRTTEKESLNERLDYYNTLGMFSIGGIIVFFSIVTSGAVFYTRNSYYLFISLIGAYLACVVGLLVNNRTSYYEKRLADITQYEKFSGLYATYLSNKNSFNAWNAYDNFPLDGVVPFTKYELAISFANDGIDEFAVVK